MSVVHHRIICLEGPLWGHSRQHAWTRHTESVVCVSPQLTHSGSLLELDWNLSKEHRFGTRQEKHIYVTAHIDVQTYAVHTYMWNFSHNRYVQSGLERKLDLLHVGGHDDGLRSRLVGEVKSVSLDVRSVVRHLQSVSLFTWIDLNTLK